MSQVNEVLISALNQDGKVASLKKRYFVKLFANLIGFVISLVTQSIIPRSLGPKSYGDFSYLTNVSTQIVGFFDMGTSIGFYTKISQRQKEFSLISFYITFSVILSAIVLFFVVLSHITSFDSILWSDQSVFFIYLAVIWAILNWYLQIINNLGDAYGLTVPIETVRIIQKIIGLILIVALFLYNRLDLTSFFFYSFTVTFLLIISIVWILEKEGHSFNQDWRLSRKEIQSYTKEFYQYSQPMFVYFLVSLIVVVLDRWFLQVFSGSEQQGFYGLSSQIGAVCFLFTSSVASLIVREFSVAYSKKDLKQMAYLFRRYIPLFYGIAAFFSCFIAMQAESVVYIFGGAKFHGATLAIAIMAFYQIHQTYGMLSGSVFMATGQTVLYSKISIITALVGIPISYFLIAPENKMGLNAGATGLAIKMVIVQCLCVNVHLYFNCHYLKLNFWRYVGHQILSVFFLLLFSALAMLVVDKVFILQHNMIIRFILSGILYSTMVLGLLCFMPLIFGLDKKDISSMTDLLLQQIRKKNKISIEQ